MHSQKPLDLYRGGHSPWICCVLLVPFLNHFQIAELYLGDIHFSRFLQNWKTKHKSNWISYKVMVDYGKHRLRRRWMSLVKTEIISLCIYHDICSYVYWRNSMLSNCTSFYHEYIPCCDILATSAGLKEPHCDHSLYESAASAIQRASGWYPLKPTSPPIHNPPYRSFVQTLKNNPGGDLID